VLDAQYWLNRVEEARLAAADMISPEAKREMLKIAAEYRRLAQHAEERAAGKLPAHHPANEKGQPEVGVPGADPSQGHAGSGM
jgi:hypothetical protein